MKMWSKRRVERSEPSAPPDYCPACGGKALSTAAKHPDAASYWRCAACGEVWNALRRAPGAGDAGGR
jgi:hypothetical protein